MRKLRVQNRQQSIAPMTYLSKRSNSMHLGKAITAASLLLIAACSQPKQELTGIVELYCFAAGGPRSDNLIIDTDNWKLLNYDIDTDKFQEQKTTPGFMKGSEVTWTIDKQEGTLTITSREAFSEKYFADRVKKSATAHANVKKYGWGAVMFTEEKLAAFDQFTKDRREDYKILRTKINLKTLSADLFEKKKFGFTNDSQATKSGTGKCIVSDPPKMLMDSD